MSKCYEYSLRDGYMCHNAYILGKRLFNAAYIINNFHPSSGFSKILNNSLENQYEQLIIKS